MPGPSASARLIVPCRAIGVLEIEQTNPRSHVRERNDRLIVVPVKASRQSDIHSVFDFSDRWRAEIAQFFLAAVAFEGKDVKVLDWGSPVEADDLVKSCSARVAEGSSRTNR